MVILGNDREKYNQTQHLHTHIPFYIKILTNFYLISVFSSLNSQQANLTKWKWFEPFNTNVWLRQCWAWVEFGLLKFIHSFCCCCLQTSIWFFQSGHVSDFIHWYINLIEMHSPKMDLTLSDELYEHTLTHSNNILKCIQKFVFTLKI